MKLFIKNNIKIFATILITTIVVGSISVYAATQYLAHDISYTPSNENFDVNNVEDALNELYSFKNGFPYLISGETQIDYYKGNRHSGEDIQLSLTKGSYYIFVVNVHALAGTVNFNANETYNVNKLNVDNGSCQLKSGYHTALTATKAAISDRKVSQFTYSQIYECQLTDDSIVKYTTDDGNYDDCSQSVILQSLKIN